MQIKHLLAAALGAGILGLGLTASRAQTTATWIGPASGGEWNTAANWDTGLAPADATTNAFIGPGTNVNYSVPMAAASFGSFANRGVLNVNAAGFNNAGILMNNPGGGAKVFVNNGGVVNVTGNFGISSNAAFSLAAGGSVTISGGLNLGSDLTGGSSGTGTLGSYGSATNNGGTLNAGSTTFNPRNQSLATGNHPLLTINGGINNLGNVDIHRSGGTSQAALGVEGLIINGGLVNMTSLRLGDNNFGTMLVGPGSVVTNSGAGTFRNTTAARPSRLLQTGGLFVTLGTNTLTVPVAAGAGVTFSVTGGTNYTTGFQFGDPAVLTSIGTVNFTNAAAIYVGGGGMSSNGAAGVNIVLNAGGRFAASADWTNAVSIGLNGGSFDLQDAVGTPHNIYCSGVLRGSGSVALSKTGGGTLTLGAVNTYLGSTMINQGVVALDASGSIATSGTIVVGANAVFDVSMVSGGYVQAAGTTLGGWGVITGAVAVASTGILDPGTNGTPGTLSFSNSVSQTGEAKNHFDLSTNPSGPNNDLIVIREDFNVSGSGNLIEISGGGPSGSVHPLFKYYGNFVGDLSSFTIVGPTGVLTNITTTTPKMIAFIPVTTVRTPTNVVWIGNVVVNDWDVLNRTNWLNNGVLDYFVSLDNVLFNSVGAANTNVSLPVAVSPGSVTVNATVDYLFAGAGGIGGAGGILKTNSGRLTILNTNQFTGGLSLKGGTLSVASLADDGVDSPIGKTGNILIDGGTLEYSGPDFVWTRPINLGTNGQNGVSVSNAATLFTMTGTLGGAGALTKSGNGTLILNGLNSFSGGTLLNAGTLIISNALGAGLGTIALNAGSLVIGPVKPANTIDVPASGSISGGNAGGLTGISRVTGSAPLGLSVTVGVFDLGGDMSAYSGAITFTNAGGAVVRLNGSIGSALAAWDLGAGPMDLNVRTGSTSNNIGALKGASGTTLSGRGGSSNNGPTTHYIGANGQSTTFDGIIQNGSGGGSSTTAINKVGGGTLTLSGASTYTGATTISLGTLALTGSASIASSASLNIVSGATLDVSGLAAPTLVVGGSQTLQGRGIILGGVDSTSGLRIAPGGGVGGSLGTLTATNAIALGGTTWMKLNRASSPSSDKLVSSLSTITYGGSLLVTNIGARLQVGDTFDLFDGSGLNGGTFATIQLPSYYTWDTTQLGVNGTVRVTAVLPPPSISSVDFSTLAGGAITLNAINGATNGPVNVLTTTNLALPLSSWTTVTTTTFDGSGNLSLPITVDPALPQSYFLLQGQ